MMVYFIDVTRVFEEGNSRVFKEDVYSVISENNIQKRWIKDLIYTNKEKIKKKNKKSYHLSK